MIRAEIKSQYAIIHLNRPDVLNSFNREMALALQAKLDEFEKEAREVFEHTEIAMEGVTYQV